MFEPKSTFYEHRRSPHVWQSRTINFNKQIIKKLNHIQKCKSNHQHGRFGLLPTASRPVGVHRLIEVSSTTSTVSSVSSPAATGFEEREATSFVKNLCVNSKKLQNAHNHHHHQQQPQSQHKMTRHCLDNSAGITVPHYTAQYPGSRCPIHSKNYHHKQLAASTNRLSETPPVTRFASLNDIHQHDYPAQSGHHYLSYPYIYPEHGSGYHYPGYPYSSQMYLPTPPYYPLHYPSGSYASKMVPLSYHQAYNVPSYDPYNQLRLIQGKQRNRCKGHLIVLAIILTVITIGVVMGLVLAITIS